MKITKNHSGLRLLIVNADAGLQPISPKSRSPYVIHTDRRTNRYREGERVIL